eukprot:2399-Heterococcus_DN1.PRE.3
MIAVCTVSEHSTRALAAMFSESSVILHYCKMQCEVQTDCSTNYAKTHLQYAKLLMSALNN